MRFENRLFGRTGLTVSPLGLATGPGKLPAREVERAFEQGIAYFYWGTSRATPFGNGIRTLNRTQRDKLTLVVQSYTRSGALMRGSLERALKQLGTDHTDLLLLGWWNEPPPAAILDAALELKQRGLTKHLMISGHNRHTFATFAKNPAYSAVMVRYNAAHPGAESEVFPVLGDEPPGLASYTATRWGHLLDPKLLPKNEPPPRASDCYRFVLTNPAVNIAMAAPNSTAELNEALATIERGPMSDDELAWMKRVGAHVKKSAAGKRTFNPIEILDRVAGWFSKSSTAGMNTRTD